MKRGWFGDSWRHGLAAKGVATKPPSKYLMSKYFATAASQREVNQMDFVGNASSGVDDGLSARRRAQFEAGEKFGVDEETPLGVLPSLTTVLRETLADKRLRELEKEDIVDNTVFGQLRKEFSEGDFSEVESMDDLSFGQKRALQAILSQQALQQVQAGLEIDADVKKRLPPVVAKQIAAIEAQQAIDTESTGSRVARRAALEGFAGVEESFKEGIKTLDIGGDASKDVVRGATDFDTNPIVGPQEDKELGKQFAEGAFNPFANDFGGELSRPLSETFTPKTKIAPIDFGVRSPDMKASEIVQKEVDSLFNARNDLGRTEERKAFDKGTRAFKEGNREKLLEAINDLEFEVEKQRNRWDMVEQTRQLVTSPTNRKVIMESSGGFSLFGSKGGRKIAEQTQKINDVKERIKDGADKARARSFNLRQKLLRMDTQVQPEQSLPKKKVDVFNEGGMSMPFRDVAKDVGSFMFGAKNE